MKFFFIEIKIEINEVFSETTALRGRFFKGLYKTMYLPFSTVILGNPSLKTKVDLPSSIK